MPARSTKVERKRREFRPADPKDVRVLFVGESPPAGPTFFYDDEAPSKLFVATAEAFSAAIPALSREPDFRATFLRLGCYLEDLSLKPVNDMSSTDRKRACKAGIELLPKRINDLSPRVVVVVGLTVSPLVVKALERAGFGDVEREVLPFPTTRPRKTDGMPYRQVYVDELATLAGRWRRRRLLRPL